MTMPKMTIEEMIDLSLAEVRDLGNGFYKILKPDPKGVKWDKRWVKYILCFCEECGEITAKVWNNNTEISKFCNSKCNLEYSHKHTATQSIIYNDIEYNIKDCPTFLKRKYHNPVEAWIESIKRSSKYKEENRDEINIKGNKRYHETKDLAAIRKRYATDEEYRTKLLTNQKKQRNNRTDEQIQADKDWHKEYQAKPEVRKRANELNSLRYHTNKKYDPIFMLRQRLRARLRCAFLSHNQQKSKVSTEYGIEYIQICNKLESDAKEYGYTMIEMVQLGYHIDHTIPLNSYDYTSSNDIEHSFSPENHRWLMAEENLSKGCRLRPEDIEVIKTLPKEIYPKSWKGVIPTTNEKETHNA